MKLRTMLIVLAALPVAAGPKDDAVKKEKEKLQGIWKPVSGEKSGKPTPEKVFKDLHFTFQGEKLRIKEGRNEQEATFTIDPSRRPKAIDITLKEGDKSFTLKGIYELEGGALKLCMGANPDVPRPTELATKAGSKTELVTLQREKP